MQYENSRAWSLQFCVHSGLALSMTTHAAERDQTQLRRNTPGPTARADRSRPILAAFAPLYASTPPLFGRTYSYLFIKAINPYLFVKPPVLVYPISYVKQLGLSPTFCHVASLKTTPRCTSILVQATIFRGSCSCQVFCVLLFLDMLFLMREEGPQREEKTM